MASPYEGPTVPAAVPADSVRRFHPETQTDEQIECRRVVACGHTWTVLHLAAYRGAGIREAVGCEDCRAALFDGDGM